MSCLLASRRPGPDSSDRSRAEPWANPPRVLTIVMEVSWRLRVGLIGCGGRGTGAAIQSLGAESGTVLHAVGDVFPGRIESCLELVAQESDAERIQVSEDRQFLGLDAYKHVIEACDVVLLCTPPGFRPLHLREAVDKGRHVFCEKPVAVDGPGVRSVLESARIAQEKNLALMSGFCWRYQNQCRETFTHLHNGGIGTPRDSHHLQHDRMGRAQAASARVERHRVSAPQLALLLVAQRRSHR